jgi:exosortase
MTSTNVPQAEQPHRPVSQAAWVWPGALLFLVFAWANAPVVSALFRTWWVSYAETGHGFIAPPLAAYLIWQKRHALAALPLAGNGLGLWVVAVCSLIAVLSHVAQWIFFSQLSLWFTIAGSIWYLAGTAWLKALRFPLLLLFLTIPPPSFLYTRLTFELQLLASRLGEMGLEILGYSVLREGNILHMVGEKLSVAEACSGIRSLVTLLFFVTIYGYFMLPNASSRILLIALAVPVAILANGFRIIATGVLSQYDRNLAHGITHDISGYITLLAGGALCVFFEYALRNTRKEVDA